MLAWVPVALAASLSIKIEQPKSPTNDNSFKINFVTLDTENRAVTVKCFKKGPSDADFVQFGSDIALPAGGNSGDCIVDSSIMNSQDTYQFYTTAQANLDNATSPTVTVSYKNEAPGTPSNYSKEKITTCDYKISFKTAADNGKTKKVEIYMSSLTNFSADSGTKVAGINVGSDQEVTTNIGAPDCNKTFYFAVRAFDDAGNGSGIIGDSNVTIITKEGTTTTTTQTTATGAIPVQSSQVGAGGEILGVSDAEATEGAKAEATGGAEPSVTPEGEVQGAESGGEVFSLRNILIVLAAIIIIGGAYLYQKSKK